MHSTYNTLVHPTNGFSIKPLKVKLLAGEQKATEKRCCSFPFWGVGGVGATQERRGVAGHGAAEEATKRHVRAKRRLCLLLPPTSNTRPFLGYDVDPLRKKKEFTMEAQVFFAKYPRKSVFF